MNPKVDAFLSKAKKWQEETTMLRSILLDCGLTEDLKWGKPCYMFQNTNLISIIGFKEYCSIMFFKGSLLKDSHGLLIKAGEHTQAMRQIRFTETREIKEKEKILRAYIQEAIEAEKAGMKVTFKKKDDAIIVEEFQMKLDENPTLKTAFEALTPGRQRAYLIHFSEPKQSKTRAARVEKCLQQILDGKGLNDEYRR